jgi:hypothetical protein
VLLTIQYLEDSPHLTHLSPQDAAARLREAGILLPITHVLIGWNVPPAILEACRDETERMGARFMRWHPLLTGGSFTPPPEWQTVGLDGKCIPGFQEMAEFTFVCPNHPQVIQASMEHLDSLLATGLYQGFFLDRVRFPSPSYRPLQDLGCFCQYCRAAAGRDDLDLDQIRQRLLRLVGEPRGRGALVWALLGARDEGLGDTEHNMLLQLLDFRERSITRFVRLVAGRLKSAGLEVGLDCFSPGLTRMVGQDLAALSQMVDWIKVMTYAHTYGPAGLPFEVLGLVDFLIAEAALSPVQALDTIGQALQLPLPASRHALEADGLSSLALAQEVAKGVRVTSMPVLAGIELVEVSGVAQLNESQITADLRAVKAVAPAGLSLSWDLWRIPLERLALVRRVNLG